MSVRQSLLSILSLGPCYGYQLRAEFNRRTGNSWPVNVGQVYNTLERLERDGLVSRGETDQQGHVFWSLLPAGEAVVSEWLSTAGDFEPANRDDLAVKIAIAVSLPGVDALTLVETHLRAAAETLAARERLLAGLPESAISEAIIESAAVARAAAEHEWLTTLSARLKQHEPIELSQPLRDEKPVRGRPAKALSEQ